MIPNAKPSVTLTDERREGQDRSEVQEERDGTYKGNESVRAYEIPRITSKRTVATLRNCRGKRRTSAERARRGVYKEGRLTPIWKARLERRGSAPDKGRT